MVLCTKCLCGVVAVGVSSALASAGTIFVSPIGGGLTLQSRDLSGTVFGTAETNWTSASLVSVHSSINASGVQTEGKVTFAALDTDQGLAFVALIDREGTPGAPSAGNIHMTSVGDDTMLAYINDVADSLTITPAGAGPRIATGNLTWNSNGEGDGFGWASLQVGDTMSFRFERIAGSPLGLSDPSTFQFVSWTGSTWALQTIPSDEASFTASGEFGFTAHVVPTPGALALALLGSITWWRRRR